MKNMLTPRKHEVHARPSVVTGKALCNVSTTSAHNPDQVLDELTRALIAKGIPCQQKGYILRGKIKDASGGLRYVVVTVYFFRKICFSAAYPQMD